MQNKVLLVATLACVIGSVMPQTTIDPNEVPLSTRQAWCNSQIAQCPLICTQETDGSAATYANTCNSLDLTYNCICSNGLSPNVSEYSQTIPYYICTQANTDCQRNCGYDSGCAAACVQNNPCGAQNPTRVNTSTVTTTSATGTSGMTAASTQTDGTVYTGFGGAAATTSASSSNGASGDSGSGAGRLVINMGQIYGLGVVAAGVFAGFTFML